LAPVDHTPDPYNFLANNARLEASGILKGTNYQINTRVKQKMKQVEVSDHFKLPAYVVVVEYSRPVVQVRHKPARR
jgi:hypothetical protein